MTRAQSAPPTTRQAAAGAVAAQRRGQAPARPGAASGAAARGGMSTPTRLRLFRGVTVVVSLVCAVVTAVLLVSAQGAVTKASGHVDQLMRLHRVKALLLQADAVAAASFLEGAAPDAAATVGDDLEQAGELVVVAAGAQPADQTDLATLNADITAFQVAMQQATDADAPDQLVRASDDLHQTVLPTVDRLIASNQAAITEQTPVSAWWVVLVAQIPALVVTVCVMVWVAGRFKRVINVGLVLAVAALLASTIITATLSQQTERDVRAVTQDRLTQAFALADARTHALDARVFESLTLLFPDQPAYRTDQETHTSAVDDALARVGSPKLSSRWQTITDNTQQLPPAADPEAVRQAQTAAASADHARAYDEFSEQADGQLADLRASNTTTLERTRPRLVGAGVGAAVLGVGAAALATWGIGRRLGEYR